ncbi:hypothetical protein C0J52_13876 [Blattella germanica]|nr:hypothetical protein C0J52_13876 [Blattella germanica]
MVRSEFYKRRPQGLRGALSELGIVFQGREHSGLCDAKNTALLAWRMVKDGAILKVTKSLESNKKPSVISTKHLVPNKLQYKGDTVQNGVHQTPRQPLKILNIATPQRRNSIHGDASPLPGTPINLKKSQSLRRALLNKCIQNCNKDSTRIVKSPIIVSKCLNTTKNESVGNISKNNLKTPNTAVRPAPSSSCKRTPPLCKCGCRATRKLVSLPGPNQGRNFFTCSKRKSLGMVQTSGCGFFRWEN